MAEHTRDHPSVDRKHLCLLLIGICCCCSVQLEACVWTLLCLAALLLQECICEDVLQGFSDLTPLVWVPGSLR